MSKLLGFGLIVSGLLIGGVAVPLSASSLAEREVQAATVPPVAGQISLEKTVLPDVRGFSVPALKPLPQAVAHAPAVLDTAPSRLAPPEPVPAMRPLAAPAPRKPIVPPFETVVLPQDPTAITRAVQMELARVGCYAGPVTGFWGPDTRRAMKAFTNRVNASLPINKPDVILLSLLRAEPAGMCGKACPAGQEGASDGRCVPKAVLAQAARKANPALAKAVRPASHEAGHPKAEERADVVASAPVVPASSILAPVYSDQQRMALAGPKVEDQAAAGETPSDVAPVPTEKPAPVKPVKKRERKEPPPSARYGQTKWAREFFRNSATF